MKLPEQVEFFTVKKKYKLFRKGEILPVYKNEYYDIGKAIGSESDNVNKHPLPKEVELEKRDDGKLLVQIYKYVFGTAQAQDKAIDKMLKMKIPSRYKKTKAKTLYRSIRLSKVAKNSLANGKSIKLKTKTHSSWTTSEDYAISFNDSANDSEGVILKLDASKAKILVNIDMLGNMFLEENEILVKGTGITKVDSTNVLPHRTNIKYATMFTIKLYGNYAFAHVSHFEGWLAQLKKYKFKSVGNIQWNDIYVLYDEKIKSLDFVYHEVSVVDTVMKDIEPIAVFNVKGQNVIGCAYKRKLPKIFKERIYKWFDNRRTSINEDVENKIFAMVNLNPDIISFIEQIKE